jgi:hypothetical protein
MMSGMRNLVAVIGLSVLACGVACADTVALKADLEPSSEVPPCVSHGHGMLNATFDTSSQVLHWTVTYTGLSSRVTAAHFHGPAPVGQNGKEEIPSASGALSSPIRGSATLDERQVADVMDGQWYFSIQTQQNPAGEIRGQLWPVN